MSAKLVWDERGMVYRSDELRVRRCEQFTDQLAFFAEKVTRNLHEHLAQDFLVGFRDGHAGFYPVF